jgi:hypothetical protein
MRLNSLSVIAPPIFAELTKEDGSKVSPRREQTRRRASSGFRA